MKYLSREWFFHKVPGELYWRATILCHIVAPAWLFVSILLLYGLNNSKFWMHFKCTFTGEQKFSNFRNRIWAPRRNFRLCIATKSLINGHHGMFSNCAYIFSILHRSLRYETHCYFLGSYLFSTNHVIARIVEIAALLNSHRITVNGIICLIRIVSSNN